MHYMERKASLQLDYIIRKDEQLIKAIENADEYLLSLIEPKDYDRNNHESAIVKMDISFEKLCTSLEELGVRNPKELTLFEFESKIAYFEEKKDKQTNIT